MSTDPNVAHYETPGIIDEYSKLREQGLFVPERRAIERYFAPGSRVLDLGCGAGRTTHALDEQGFDVVGVDASSGMIAAASAADADVQYLVGDASSLPFSESEFDNVLFSYNGLDELNPEAERLEALREIRRVLTPGGKFVFSTRNILRSLIPFPPTVDTARDLVAFWRLNLEADLVGTPYKQTRDGVAGNAVYHSNPNRQARQLNAAGLELVTLLDRDTLRSKYFGPVSFFVAERPD